MESLVLLRGDWNAPGWKNLEMDSKEDKVNLLIFDKGAWALINTAEAPTKYEGLVPEKPADGLYVSQQGYPVYVVNCHEVRRPEEVIKALGEEAEATLAREGDPVRALERLGRAF